MSTVNESINENRPSQVEVVTPEMIERQKRFYQLYKDIAAVDCQKLVFPATMMQWAEINGVLNRETLETITTDPVHSNLFRALLLKALQYSSDISMDEVLHYKESLSDFFQQLVDRAIRSHQAGYRPLGIIANPVVAAAVPYRTEASIVDVLEEYDVEGSIEQEMDDQDANFPDVDVYQELYTLDLEVSAIQFKEVITAIADQLYGDAAQLPGMDRIDSASGVMDLAAQQNDRNLARLRKVLVGSKSQNELSKSVISDFIDIGVSLNNITELVAINGLEFAPEQIRAISEFMKKLINVIGYNLASAYTSEIEQKLSNILPLIKNSVTLMQDLVQAQVNHNKVIGDVQSTYSPNIGKRLNATGIIKALYEWAGRQGNKDLEMRSKLNLDAFADVDALEVMNEITGVLDTQMSLIWKNLQGEIDSEIVRLEQAMSFEPQLSATPSAEVASNPESDIAALLAVVELADVTDGREWIGQILANADLITKLAQLLANYKLADLPTTIPETVRTQLISGNPENIKKFLGRWTKSDQAWNSHGKNNTEKLRIFISEKSRNVQSD